MCLFLWKEDHKESVLCAIRHHTPPFLKSYNLCLVCTGTWVRALPCGQLTPLWKLLGFTLRIVTESRAIIVSLAYGQRHMVPWASLGVIRECRKLIGKNTCYKWDLFKIFATHLCCLACYLLSHYMLVFPVILLSHNLCEAWFIESLFFYWITVWYTIKKLLLMGFQSYNVVAPTLCPQFSSQHPTLPPLFPACL